MTFSFSDEQAAFIETVTATCRRHCSMAATREAAAGPRAWVDLWEQLVALDLNALLIPEEDGGLELSAVELVGILEAVGHLAPPVPLATTIGMFAPLVLAARDRDDAANEILDQVLSGASGTVALADDGTEPCLADDRHLSGRVVGIPEIARASLLAVPARRAEDGARVLVVGSPDELGATSSPAMDPTDPLGALHLDGRDVGSAHVLGRDPAAAYATVWTAAAAELVGLAAELVARASAYAAERRQFGAPIGAFQAVKHQLVDAHIAVERARSLTWYAGLKVADGPGSDPSIAAHRAKAAASEAASFAAATAVQVHGGVGITVESDISLLYLRARQLSTVLGGPDYHYACALASR